MRDERAALITVELPEPSLSIPWPTERDAIRALAAVACFVGVPALAAVGAVVAMFALSAAVLVAPLVALALAWAAWHCNRAPPHGKDAAAPGAEGQGRAPHAPASSDQFGASARSGGSS